MNANHVIAFLLLSLPATAGEINVLGSNSNPVLIGPFSPSTPISFTVTGGVSLVDSPGSNLMIIADGSQINPSPAGCDTCWVGYQYFLAGGAYPHPFGGDGVNHFAGGGGNYDIHNDSHPSFAAEGKQTTDTTDPDAIRFGALAYSWDGGDWKVLGFQNTLQAPFDDTLLQLVVVDAVGAYYNDSGEYKVYWREGAVPEPSTFLLISLPVVGFLGRKKAGRR